MPENQKQAYPSDYSIRAEEALRLISGLASASSMRTYYGHSPDLQQHDRCVHYGHSPLMVPLS